MAPSSTYPPPLVVPHTSPTHTKTLIILHGRGSTASKFAPPLLYHPVTPLSLPLSSTEASPKTFHEHFPTSTLIFPTASLRRAAHYNRALTHQWFDLYPLDEFPPDYRQHIQLQGLKESILHVWGWIREVMKDIGAGNIVLVGLSQGCATAILSALLWKGEALGGVVGMCGWIPLEADMREILDTNGEDDALFETEEDESHEKSKLDRVVEWLREELDLGGADEIALMSNPMIRTPVFLGHGTQDEKVPFGLGKSSATLLRELDIEVSFERYEGLGHWYSADMLRDVVCFIEKIGGIDHEKSASDGE